MQVNNTSMISGTNPFSGRPIMGVKVKYHKGAWWVFINWRKRRQAKRIGASEGAANEAAAEIAARLALGQYDWDEKKTMTFEDYSADWLEKYIKPLRRETTYKRYKAVLKKYIWPVIGKIAVDKLKRFQIRDMLLKYHKAGKSVSTLLLLRDIVSGVMNCAVDDELIPANPTREIIKTLGIKRDRQTEVRPFTSEEVDLILSKCAEIYPEYYPFMLTAFRTGMRLGEILALQWSDVNWNKGLIHVKRSYRNRRLTKTKTGKARQVEMSNELVSELRALLIDRKKQALVAGSNEPVIWIFHNGGSPIAQNSVRYIWRLLLDKAGMQYEKFHAARHTYASLLLSAGVSVYYVSKQMGHSSIQITIDIYGHFIPSESRRGVDVLDGAHSKPMKRRGDEN